MLVLLLLLLLGCFDIGNVQVKDSLGLLVLNFQLPGIEEGLLHLVIPYEHLLVKVQQALAQLRPLGLPRLLLLRELRLLSAYGTAQLQVELQQPPPTRSFLPAAVPRAGATNVRQPGSEQIQVSSNVVPTCLGPGAARQKPAPNRVQRS